jgi:hypothetical protein
MVELRTGAARIRSSRKIADRSLLKNALGMPSPETPRKHSALEQIKFGLHAS